MPLPVIPNVQRVTLNWVNSAGGIAATVMNVHAPSLSEADVRAAFNANWTNNMNRTMTSTCTMPTMDIIKLDGTSPTQTFDGVGNDVGQGNDQGIPSQCTLLLIQTGARGPRARGRAFLPFIAENQVNDGVINASELATQATAWNTFLAAMLADGVVLGVASYKHETFEEALTLSFSPYAATQKRRLDRIAGRRT